MTSFAVGYATPEGALLAVDLDTDSVIRKAQAIVAARVRQAEVALFDAKSDLAFVTADSTLANLKYSPGYDLDTVTFEDENRARTLVVVPTNGRGR